MGTGCFVNAVGAIATQAFNVAPATSEEETGTYARILAASTVEAVQEFHMSGTLTGTGIFSAKQLPYCLFIIKTEGTISDRIIYAGFTSDPATPPAAGNEHLPAAAGQFLNTFAFFYKPAALGGIGASDNWQIIRRSTGVAATIFDTGVLVEINKVYILEFTFERSIVAELPPTLDYKYTAYINYVQVPSITQNDITNSPVSDNFPDPGDNLTTASHPFIWVRNKTAGLARGLKVNRIYAEWGNDTDLLADTWSKHYGLTSI